MSYQQPQLPAGPPVEGQDQGNQQGGPVQRMTAQEESAEQVLQEILGGELPGAAYLFPDDPLKRQANLITTTPDAARNALLRSIETMSQSLLLPYGMEKKAELGKAILECAQAYLLLDPTVDQQGIPVGAQAEAQGEAQAAAAHAQGEAQRLTAEHGHGLATTLETHKADLQARTAAHASGAEFRRPVTDTGYVEPPRVQPNPAEAALAQKHKAQTQELAGARGDRPRPQPRVGS